MSDNSNNILMLFHHIHHENGEHKVHHCGGKHVQFDPAVSYSIEHCSCGKHRIDKETATGHGFDLDGKPPIINVHFTEICPDGGWHVESGVVV